MAIYKSSFTRAQIEEALNRALNVVTEGKSFTLKGEWTSGGSYANSASTVDVVIYDGVSYFCRVTHSGRSTNPKADTTYWGQLAGYEPLIKNVPQEDIDESDTIFFTDASDNGSTKRVTLANFTSKFPSGRGIASIERTSGTGAPGTTDTYTITYTDNNTTTFQIYNGAEGAKGDKGEPGADGADGIDGRPIEFRETATHIQWRYVGDATWNNLFALTSLKGDTGSGLEFNWNGTQLGIRVEGETSYQYIDLKGGKGDPGNDGADGRGIVSIARTSGTGAAGTTDTYTITFTDSTTATFQIYNGADGQGAGDMLLSVYDPTGKNTDIFGYVDNKVKTDVPAGAKFTDTVYTHPASHPPSIIAQDASNRFVSDAEKSAWNSKAAGTHSHAQSDVTGLSTSLSGKVDKVTGKGLSTEDYTTTEKNKLANIEPGAQVNTITSVAGKTGAVTLAKSDVGLGNVGNVKQMPIAGGTFTGAAVAQTNTSYTTRQLRNVVMSASDPSGGSNGDIWIKYT